MFRKSALNFFKKSLNFLKISLKFIKKSLNFFKETLNFLKKKLSDWEFWKTESSLLAHFMICYGIKASHVYFNYFLIL